MATRGWRLHLWARGGLCPTVTLHNDLGSFAEEPAGAVGRQPAAAPSANVIILQGCLSSSEIQKSRTPKEEGPFLWQLWTWLREESIFYLLLYALYLTGSLIHYHNRPGSQQTAALLTKATEVTRSTRPQDSHNHSNHICSHVPQEPASSSKQSSH